MNGLSDSLTIGLVLALVFGALFFYIYSRIGQVEKRVSLTENILLDLKMATENTLMAMHGGEHPSEDSYAPSEARYAPSEVVIHPVSGPQPMDGDDVEQIPDEDFYKSVLQNTTVAGGQAAQESTVVGSAEETGSVSEKTTRLEANYESMTLKELKALAKQRGITTSNLTNKKDFIDALKRQGQTQGSVLEPVPGSEGTLAGGLEEGFPVELGAGGSA